MESCGIQMDPDMTGNPGSSYCMRITADQDFGEFVLYALNLNWRGFTILWAS